MVVVAHQPPHQASKGRGVVELKFNQWTKLPSAWKNRDSPRKSDIQNIVTLWLACSEIQIYPKTRASVVVVDVDFGPWVQPLSLNCLLAPFPSALPILCSASGGVIPAKIQSTVAKADQSEPYSKVTKGAVAIGS